MIWMTARRFEWLLHARGPAIAAWPPRERDSAMGLLRRSADARGLLADALADSLMDGETDGEMGDAPALVRMQGVVRRAVSPPSPLLRGVRWGAIAACLAAGLYFGVPAMEADSGSELGPTMQADLPATVLAALD